MENKNPQEIKSKIIETIKNSGPSLPIPVAREVEITTLFVSAFLSELIAEKVIKISNMKVGNSPLYFLPGQEPLLENFSDHLRSKEKEAFNLLKENNFLKDVDQEPAIRVALRSIRDFAIPFKKENEIYWRYFKISEQDFKSKEKEEELGIFEKENEPEKNLEKPKIELKKEKIKRDPKKVKKNLKTQNSQKKNEKFFNRVKEFLMEKNIEILDIESFNKNDLVLRIKSNEKEKILVAFNKKRISEADILKAAKKASEYELEYIILSLGEPLKKLINLWDALKGLSEIETLK